MSAGMPPEVGFLRVWFIRCCCHPPHHTGRVSCSESDGWVFRVAERNVSRNTVWPQAGRRRLNTPLGRGMARALMRWGAGGRGRPGSLSMEIKSHKSCRIMSCWVSSPVTEPEFMLGERGLFETLITMLAIRILQDSSVNSANSDYAQEEKFARSGCAVGGSSLADDTHDPETLRWWKVRPGQESHMTLKESWLIPPNAEGNLTYL